MGRSVSKTPDKTQTSRLVYTVGMGYRKISNVELESNMEKVNFAFVGCGRIVKKHAEAITKQLTEKAKLVAVCDLKKDRAKSTGLLYGVPHYTSYDEMLSTHPKINIVSILTESGNHSSNTIDIVKKYQKHILVEKPMALNLSRADEMIYTCDEYGVKLFVVKQNRYNLPVIKLKQALEADQFGKLVMGTVRVRWSRDQNYYNQDEWRGTWEMDGGVFSNQASHHIDLLEWMLGEPVSVFAKSRTALVNIEVEDTGVAIINFKNGAIGIVEATTATRPKDLEGSLSILGELGIIGDEMKKQIIRLAKPIIERFPKLAMTYRYMRDSWQIYEEPQETPMGFKLVGNQSMQKGLFEPEETQIVKQIIPNVDIVINVGANIGYYCCIALSYKKYVVAFEPINLNLRYLLRNIKANNWESGIEVYPMALSNKKAGVIEIYGGGTGASLVKGWAGTPEQYVTLVPSTTLENILGSKFQTKRCFILVDIEGAEQLMLEGASSIINMVPKPIWMMEISISEHQPKGIKINPNLLSTFKVFWSNGYEAWTADEQCRIIHPDEIEQIIRSGVDIPHTHNFLFIEKGEKIEFLDA